MHEEGNGIITHSVAWFGENETPPGPGAYLVLWYHHDGESHWCSLGQLRERIQIILWSKPDAEERLAYLTAIPWSEAVVSAQGVYEETRVRARRAYSEAYADESSEGPVAYAARLFDRTVACAERDLLETVHIGRGNAMALARNEGAHA